MEKYSDIPDYIKRDCELRGISLEQFIEIQQKWAELINKIRNIYEINDKSEIGK